MSNQKSVFGIYLTMIARKEYVHLEILLAAHSIYPVTLDHLSMYSASTNMIKENTGRGGLSAGRKHITPGTHQRQGEYLD